MKKTDKPVDEFDASKYKFNEGQLITELCTYINSTYSEHYSKNKFQSTEFIIDCGHGEGFALGNVLKYVQRYGKKDGRNRKDLLKVLHYGIIALYNHDHDEEKDKSKIPEDCYVEYCDNSGYVYENLPHSDINKSSIDDATPKEWNNLRKKSLRKSSLKGETDET